MVEKKNIPQAQTTATGTSASDRVVRDILRGLYEKRYVSGQRLPESDLVTLYGVSRTTVREAVRRLAEQGVVEIHPNKGARIKTVTLAKARQLLLVTERIVGLAARLAAENIEEPSAREDLAAALEPLVGEGEDSNQYNLIRQRNHFHRTLARIAQSPEMENILSNIQVHLIRNQLDMRPEDRARSYQNIADKVLAGDCAGAEDAARAQVRTMITRLEAQEQQTEGFHLD